MNPKRQNACIGVCTGNGIRNVLFAMPYYARYSTMHSLRFIHYSCVEGNTGGYDLTSAQIYSRKKTFKLLGVNWKFPVRKGSPHRQSRTVVIRSIMWNESPCAMGNGVPDYFVFLSVWFENINSKQAPYCQNCVDRLQIILESTPSSSFEIRVELREFWGQRSR